MGLSLKRAMTSGGIADEAPEAATIAARRGKAHKISD